MTGVQTCALPIWIYTKERIAEISQADWIYEPDRFQINFSEGLGKLKQMWINLFLFLGQVAYDQATDIITLYSGNAATEVEFGAEERKISIIPNGIEPTRFNAIYDQHMARWQTSPEKKYVGFIGRVVPIKDVKTLLRAARIARGSLETTGTEPTVLPVGVNFMDKGEFRGSVYVQVGEAINLSALAKENPKDTVRRLTALIESALNAVTLSAESVEDLELSRRLERFFALRRGRYRHATLEQRVRALKKLLEWRQLLRERDPKRVAALSRQLDRFDRLCRHFGVRDYQLTLRYSPVVIARFVLRTLLILAVILPLGLWGWVNSAFPYVLTRVLVRRQSVELQDRDFRRMEYGSILFLGAWAIQSAIVGGLFGPVAAVAYLLSLPPAFAAALALKRERSRISENIHWFFLLLRKRSLRDFLLAHRKELEKELAQMTRLLKHQPN